MKHESGKQTKPLKIKLTADRKLLIADKNDISYLTLQIVDQQDELCHNYNHPIRLYVTGDAFLTGLDHESATLEKQTKSDYVLLNNGSAFFILQSGSTPGYVSVTAMAEGVKFAIVRIKICRLRSNTGISMAEIS